MIPARRLLTMLLSLVVVTWSVLASAQNTPEPDQPPAKSSLPPQSDKPVSPEPEVPESKVSESEAPEPEEVEPDALEPETSEPEATELEASESEAPKPEASGQTLDDAAMQAGQRYAEMVADAKAVLEQAQVQARQAYDDQLRQAADMLIADRKVMAQEELRQFELDVAKLEGEADERTLALFDTARQGIWDRSERDIAAIRVQLAHLLATDPVEMKEPVDEEQEEPATEAMQTVAEEDDELVGNEKPAATLFRLQSRTRVILMVQDGDINTRSELWINGRRVSDGAVRTDRVTPYVTHYRFSLRPDDVVVVTCTDNSVGALTFLLSTSDGQLISYSHPGLPVTTAADAPARLSSTTIKRWEGAVPVARSTATLRGAATPDPMPDDWSAIWTGSLAGGRCHALVYPRRPGGQE